MSGPANFSQPIQAQSVVIDGVVYDEIPDLKKSPTSAGAHIFEMADASRNVQIPFLELAESISPQWYEFAWTQQADLEAEWFAVDALRASARIVWLVPYTVEVEVFRLAAGANTMRLARPIAPSQYSSFEVGLYPDKAFLNGVEQTVVGTSPPSASEITVGATADGDDVETPTVSAGDLLEVRYYPAYSVVFPNLEESHPRFNDRVRSVTAVEVNKQRP